MVPTMTAGIAVVRNAGLYTGLTALLLSILDKKVEHMKRFIPGYLAGFLLFLAQTSSIAQPIGSVEIQIDNNLSFEIPRNWVVLSENKTTELDSYIKSVLPISSNVKFQANLKNDDGRPITTVQIYRWQSEMRQKDAANLSENDVQIYDNGMYKQARKELAQAGGSISDWHGTKKRDINGLIVLLSEYSRPSKLPPFGHFRVQVLRVYSGNNSFSFVISYHEESSIPLRNVVDQVISTLRCTRCA